jgi:hypothetical protein
MKLKHFLDHRFAFSCRKFRFSRRRYREMDADELQRIQHAISVIRRIEEATSPCPSSWDQHIAAARSVIQTVDATSLMQQSTQTADKIIIISHLQNLAYYDPDSGGIQDIAEWCVTQWLRLLQYDSESVEALEGMFKGPSTERDI